MVTTDIDADAAGVDALATGGAVEDTTSPPVGAAAADPDAAATDALLTAGGFREPLPLTPDIRTGYEKRLVLCRRMWQTTADPRAIAEAQTWTFHYRAPIEPWLEEAVVQLAVQALSAEQIKKHRENMQHFERGSYVWDLHKGGLTWAQAKAATVAAIERSGRYVTAGTVWESYKKVLKDLRRGRNSVYRYFNDIRYRHLG